MKNTIFPLLILFAISCTDEPPTPTSGYVSEPAKIELDAGPDLEFVLPLRSDIPIDLRITNPQHITLMQVWRQLEGPKLEIKSSHFRILEPGTYKHEISLLAAQNVVAIDTLTIYAKRDNACPTPQPVELKKTFISRLDHYGTFTSLTSANEQLLFTAGYYEGLDIIDPNFDQSVYIYNIKQNSWSSTNLIEAKAQQASTYLDGKIYFAGGNTSVPTSTVQIYDQQHALWDTIVLSSARSRLAIVATSNKIFFAGGSDKNGKEVSTIDIYDVKEKSWSRASLKEPRKDISAIAVNNKVYFVGGSVGAAPLKTIDVYDVSSETMSSLVMQTARYNAILNSFDNKIFIGGGKIDEEIQEFSTELINVNSTASVRSCLSEYAFNTAMPTSAVYNGKIYIMNPQSPRGTIDIYDPSTNTWMVSTSNLDNGTMNIALFENSGSLYLVQSTPKQYGYLYTILKVD
jgi:hypothetical protein